MYKLRCGARLDIVRGRRLLTGPWCCGTPIFSFQPSEKSLSLCVYVALAIYLLVSFSPSGIHAFKCVKSARAIKFNCVGANRRALGIQALSSSSYWKPLSARSVRSTNQLYIAYWDTWQQFSRSTRFPKEIPTIYCRKNLQ